MELTASLSTHRPRFLAALTVIAVAAATLLGNFTAPPAQAAAPTTVTVVGSHNSEMGCEVDWDAQCDAAQLTPRADGLWEGDFTLPAGSYEYKIVINES